MGIPNDVYWDAPISVVIDACNAKIDMIVAEKKSEEVMYNYLAGLITTGFHDPKKLAQMVNKRGTESSRVAKPVTEEEALKQAYKALF